MKKDLMKIKAVHDWAMQWFEDFQHAIEAHPNWYTLEVSTLPTDYGFNKVTTIGNGVQTAEAICNEDDAYSFSLGVAVAWAKLHNIPLPTELSPTKYIDLLKVKPDDVFEFDGIKYVALNTIFADDTDGNSYAIINVWCDDCGWFDMLTINTNLPKKARRAKLLN